MHFEIQIWSKEDIHFSFWLNINDLKKNKLFLNHDYKLCLLSI